MGHVKELIGHCLNMLRTLTHDQKSDWKSYIPTIVHSYNCAKHGSTGYSPFFLMFGRHPRLPMDLVLGLDADKTSCTSDEYVTDLRERLDYAYRLAAEHSAQS